MTLPFVRTSFLALMILPVLAVLGVAQASARTEASHLCWGLALDGYPITSAMLDTVEREVGVPPKIVVFFLQWPSRGKETVLHLDSLDAIQARGAIPCITWEPMYYEDGREKTIAHERILKGEYDLYISSFARAAKKWRKPLIIRFAHEMNLERYHWGTDKDGYGPQSPEIYKKMFRYVVSAFRKAGASNVLWAFCPNSESMPNVSFAPDSSWNEIANYYPGNDNVDLVGADGYNWGTTQTPEKNGWRSCWRSFEDLFQTVHAKLRALAPGKPFIVFETATVIEGGDKELWIREAVRVASEWNMQGLVWFHVQKEQDWQFNRGISASCATAVSSATNCSPKSLETMGKR